MGRSRKPKIGAKGTITAFVLVIAVCLIAVLVLTCNNGVISSDEAFEIVLEDLGMTAQEAGAPHVHEGTYENQPCYNVYVTANGESLHYVVSTTGEILHKGDSTHSH